MLVYSFAGIPHYVSDLVRFAESLDADYGPRLHEMRDAFLALDLELLLAQLLARRLTIESKTSRLLGTLELALGRLELSANLC